MTQKGKNMPYHKYEGKLGKMVRKVSDMSFMKLVQLMMWLVHKKWKTAINNSSSSLSRRNSVTQTAYKSLIKFLTRIVRTKSEGVLVLSLYTCTIYILKTTNISKLSGKKGLNIAILTCFQIFRLLKAFIWK